MVLVLVLALALSSPLSPDVAFGCRVNPEVMPIDGVDMSGCSYKWQTAKIRSKKEERDYAYTRRNKDTVFDFCNRQTSEVSGGRTILNYEVISIAQVTGSSKRSRSRFCKSTHSRA